MLGTVPAVPGGVRASLSRCKLGTVQPGNLPAVSTSLARWKLGTVPAVMLGTGQRLRASLSGRPVTYRRAYPVKVWLARP